MAAIMSSDAAMEPHRACRPGPDDHQSGLPAEAAIPPTPAMARHTAISWGGEMLELRVGFMRKIGEEFGFLT